MKVGDFLAFSDKTLRYMQKIFFTTYSQTALLHLQQMVLLGLSYRLMLLHDQRADKSLGVIRTHVSRVAPDRGL